MPTLPFSDDVSVGERGEGTDDPIAWRNVLRKSWGIALIALGVVLAGISLVTPVALSHLAPAAALCIFGLVALRGPREPSRLRVLDVLAVLIVIPLAPYYANSIASSLWGNEWWALPIAPRLGILGLATFSALIVSVTAILLKRSEVKHFRRQGLYQVIREAVPYAGPDGERLPYQEREDLISGLEQRWARVRLPLQRCRLLIAAGIEPEAARDAETQKLTDENLKTMVWLAGNQSIQDESCSS